MSHDSTYSSTHNSTYTSTKTVAHVLVPITYISAYTRTIVLLVPTLLPYTNTHSSNYIKLFAMGVVLPYVLV